MKLKALESEFPCKHCGHAEKQHGVTIEQAICWGCCGLKSKTMNKYRHVFEGDNLRYLEQLSDKSK